MPVKCPAIVRLPHPPQGSRGQPSIWIDKQICIPYTVYNRLRERPSMKIRVHRPLREEVYDALRRAIVQGELSPGNRVVETELAGRLGVSRTQRVGLQEHRAILQAIKDRDPARAERLIVEHVLRKKETVLASLRSRGETRRNETP